MRKIITILFSVLFLLTFNKISAQGQSSLITQEPTDQYTVEGQTATFSIEVEPLDPGYIYDYAWHRNGSYIGFPQGAFPECTTPATIAADSGDVYFIVVSKIDSAAFTVVEQDTSKSVILHVTASGNRVTAGLQVLYDFKEGTGNVVHDVSGIGSPVDLTIDNPSATTWTPFGLGINDIAYINEDPTPTKVISSAVSANEITLEVWIDPAYAIQREGARILTLSLDTQNSDFSLLQSEGYYTARVRTTTTSSRGEPDLSTSVGEATSELTHLVFTRSNDGTTKIYKNGNVIATGTAGGDFSNWDSTGYQLQFGNEFGSPREWLGTYYLVSIYNRALSQAEVQGNYNIGVLADGPPKIIIEPSDNGAIAGDPAVFKVNAAGNSPLTYQWRKNGIDIPGADGSSYTIASVSINDSGNEYSCIVSNSSGSDVSREAKLYVTDPDNRVTSGTIALYDFQESAGDTIKDNSNFGTPLNLLIATPNSVKWKPFGLQIDSAADITSISAASKISNEIITNGEFTFESWIKPKDLLQSGPATIATISQNSSNKNFAIGQSTSSLATSLRSSATGNNGANLNTPSNSFEDSLVHVVYTHKKEISKIYINGTQISSTYITGNLGNWNNTYFLKLANQFSADQSWKGVYNLISIFNRALDSAEVVHNYLQGPVGDVPVSAPSNLSAQAQFKSVALSWDDNSTNEEGFIIERKIGDTSSVNVYSIIDTVNADGTAFVDTLISDTTTYTYRIKAYNELDESPYSNEVFVTSLLSTINAPTNLAAILATPDSDKVTLSWDDNSSNETGFVIERKIGDSTSANIFDVLDSLSANEVSYIDSSITADTTLYTYRVYAFNNDTMSAYSNEATVTSILLSIEAPSNLTAVLNAQDSFKVDLNWTDNSSNESGFVVERKLGDTSSTNSFETIDSLNANQISYTDSTVSDSTTYTYRVYAYSSINISDYSNAAQVTTPIIVGIESFTQIPKEFELSQNYPNPFNPSTIIRYAIPTSAAVTITLYNTLGQEITKIYNGELNAGVHEVNFNASNLSSGVYFYRLEAHGANGKNFISTKRMLLLK